MRRPPDSDLNWKSGEGERNQSQLSNAPRQTSVRIVGYELKWLMRFPKLVFLGVSSS